MQLEALGKLQNIHSVDKSHLIFNLSQILLRVRVNCARYTRTGISFVSSNSLPMAVSGNCIMKMKSNFFCSIFVQIPFADLIFNSQFSLLLWISMRNAIEIQSNSFISENIIIMQIVAHVRDETH